MNKTNCLREIPSINVLLEHPQISNYRPVLNRNLILSVIREEVEAFRDSYCEMNENDFPLNILIEKIESRLRGFQVSSLKPVVNATGILLNTNLGRAPLGKIVLDHLLATCDAYSNLEFDLAEGKRGKRQTHLQKLNEILSNSEAISVVNNNAAAVFLVIRALAQGKEVLVSRGELVEIGGGFRIPEILELSDAKLVEVGTTNRTRGPDYEKAINDKTAIILKTHRSNFSIDGFHEETSISELKKLSHRYGIYLVYDLGSGLLKNNPYFKKNEEPSVEDALKDGADLVLFSGDKLLGGPQCGIIMGKKELVNKIEAHPLMRTYRVGKLTIAALESVLSTYFHSQKEWPEDLPLYQFLSRPFSSLHSHADRIYDILMSNASHTGFTFSILEGLGRCGGGTTPSKTFKSYEVAIACNKIPPDLLFHRLLSLQKPIVSTLRQGSLVLNMFSIQDKEIDYIGEKISQILCDISLSGPQDTLIMEKHH